MNNSWWRSIALALVAILALGACNGDDGEPDNEARPSASASDATVTEEEGEPVVIKYNVWDDTDSNPLQGNPVIEVDGEDPWEANMKPGAATEEIGEVNVGSNIEFTLYPDGPDGQSIPVEIFIDPELLPQTDEPLDVIVYIEDEVVIVDSSFVGFSEEFPREA